MIVLNHTIVRAREKERSAQFFATLLGTEVGKPSGPFVPVRVNGDLTLDFDDRHEFVPGHYAFLVDEASFDDLLSRLQRSDFDYGSESKNGWDRGCIHLNGGRGVYVRDPDGHSYEFFTVAP